MVYDLKTALTEVQAFYESAKEGDGLVGKLESSDLQRSQKDILQALFEQASRTFYMEQLPSFNNVADKPHLPIHNPSLLWKSPIFLKLGVLSIKEFISQTDEHELKEPAEIFYERICSKFGRYLPEDKWPFITEDITILMEDFYDWHIRPTLNVAAEIRFDAAKNNHPSFKGDVTDVRRHMNKVYQNLLQTVSIENVYEEIFDATSEILKIIDRADLDEEYSEDSIERRLLVNLYAGAYLIKCTAEDRKGNSGTKVKVQPPHRERFEGVEFIKDE